MNAKEILEKNGFDFEVFEIENEHSAKNILKAMREYAIYCCEEQRIICADVAETEPYTERLTGEVSFFVNSESIIYADFPKFLNETE